MPYGKCDEYNLTRQATSRGSRLFDRRHVLDMPSSAVSRRGRKWAHVARTRTRFFLWLLSELNIVISTAKPESIGIGADHVHEGERVRSIFVSTQNIIQHL